MVSESRRGSVGGGGSSSILLSGPPKAGAIQWGGGLYHEFSVNGTLFKFLAFPKGGPGPLPESATGIMTTQVVVGFLHFYRSCTYGGFSLCTDFYTSDKNVALVAEVFRASEYFWHCMHARRDYSSQNWK